jgi:hypothetical protein
MAKRSLADSLWVMEGKLIAIRNSDILNIVNSAFVSQAYKKEV